MPPQMPGVYPAELEGTFQTRDGELLIRPLRPSDEPAHAAFFAHLSPEDVRLRFFAALRELPPKLMFRLTHIDYVSEMAFIAVQPATGDTVAVARLVRDGLSKDGEYAVATRPDMKGHGIANHLMQRLFDWGRAQGMDQVHALILSENRPMLAFARKLGCTMRRDPGDGSLILAEMKL